LVVALFVTCVLSGCTPILLPSGLPLPPNPVRNGNVGTNLGFVADWSSELPFVDVIKSGRPWTSNRAGQPWGGGGPLALDANGWITHLESGQYADLALLNVQGHFPKGRYTLLFDGDGTLSFPSGATVVSRATGRWEVDVPVSSTGVFLRESATNDANPIRNIRLIMPGYESTYGTQPFNPVFLQRLQPYDTLRFLWWMRTASTSAPGAMVNWSERTTPTYAFQSDHGVALEYMIQLANQLHVDPWFTLPHDASDDYVRQFATMVRNRLRTDLKAWVEYSNETWNGIYPSSTYTRQQGTALGLSSDPYQAQLFYTGRRAAEMFRIWEQVFGGRDRFVRVLASQASNPWTGQQVIAGAGGGANADVIAIAPYFTCVRELLATAEGAAQVVAMTDDEILDRCTAEIQGDVRTWISRYAQIARDSGLRLAAYEGGQHMVGIGSQQGNLTLAAKLNQVNRNPRMYDIYGEYLDLWRSLGGDEYVNFTSCALSGQYGSFGVLEWQDQDPSTAPKYRAVTEAAA
jgi:hypothetical protein